MAKYKDSKYKCIGRGKCGWHAETINMSSSGGTLEGYLKDAEENALVYDAQNADHDAFVDLVIKGPMLSCSLAPDEIDSFTKQDKEAAQRMLPGLSGGFETMAKMAIVGMSSLDRVGIGIYEKLLRKVPGMKFGHVKDGQVIWE